MESFTINKIAGAVLGTCLIGMGIKLAAEIIYEPGPPKTPGYALPMPTPQAAGGTVKAPEVAPIAVRLAKADPKRGEADAKVCSACHNFQEGAGAKVGPGLYGVVDRPKGKQEGFDYSAGMKGKGGNWTYADLDQFITKPSAYVQGTKMGYPGEEDADKRADIIAWLRTLSKTPAPLPDVSQADKKAAVGGEKTADKGSEAPAKAGAEAGAEADFLKLVGSADPKKGQADAQVCSACHNLKKGGGALIGPPLWNVVDRKKGTIAGYDYSAGLKKKGGDWSVNDLNAWLTNPAAYIPGTKMGYPGEADAKKRAAIIAFLRTLSDSPIALPKENEGAAKADKDHPGETKNMVPEAKPGDQQPPAPPNKPGAAQPVPKDPEPTNAAGGPTKPDVARPGMPGPSPTHDEGNRTTAAAQPAAPAAAQPAASPALPPTGSENGAEPYHASDPQYPAAGQPEQTLPKENGGAPSLTPDGFKGGDQAPEPYSAPDPADSK